MAKRIYIEGVAHRIGKAEHSGRVGQLLSHVEQSAHYRLLRLIIAAACALIAAMRPVGGKNRPGQ